MSGGNLNLRDNSVETHLGLLRQDNPEVEALIAIYPEDQYERLLANKQKLNKVLKAFNNMNAMASCSVMLMTCNRLTCPYRDSCILLKNDLAPEGSSCPIEKKIVSEVEFEIVNSLKIDRNNPIEMELLWDLIDTKLLDMRTSGFLRDGSVIQIVKNKIGQMENEHQDLSPAIQIKLELKKLKHNIIDSFVATRRAKKKYGISQSSLSLEELLKSAVGIKDSKDITDAESD